MKRQALILAARILAGAVIVTAILAALDWAAGG